MAGLKSLDMCLRESVRLHHVLGIAAAESHARRGSGIRRMEIASWGEFTLPSWTLQIFRMATCGEADGGRFYPVGSGKG